MTDGINQFDGFAFSRQINCGGLAVDEYEADLPELKDRDRDLPISDFYADWAVTQFGCEAAEEIAVIFTEITESFHVQSLGYQAREARS